MANRYKISFYTRSYEKKEAENLGRIMCSEMVDGYERYEIEASLKCDTKEELLSIISEFRLDVFNIYENNDIICTEENEKNFFKS